MFSYFDTIRERIRRPDSQLFTYLVSYPFTRPTHSVARSLIYSVQHFEKLCYADALWKWYVPWYTAATFSPNRVTTQQF